ncbi:exonuclease domain-containing protein [Bifidobacterium sp. ESL0784]|uniref:exonuclease domain-containing protein n=1 Tax=Bifidobacterium sp. ESL0784 TaxID=2983231 RepID=UPI0023F6181F|nr:exonuclease domain-containing protein [Bifidobacterium sp. ESL0784]MDF7640760.1 exonuclease domain-containing protein [Bifidobacterium sp. ESL0784]
MKQRATLDRQIQILHEHGVTFEKMDEQRARSFLSANSYFFKIKSYEKNYQRIPAEQGYQYDGLDFGYLVELSLIDFALSRLVWSLCSNIEHSIKVDFNNRLMGDNDPDIGEKCVRRMFHGDTPPLHHDNPYTDDLVVSCHNEFVPWQLWELLGFKDQLALYDTYYQMKGSPLPKKHLLFIVRKMRNAVSHGNCLLADMNRQVPARANKQEISGAKNGSGNKIQTDVEVTKAALQMCDRKLKNKGTANQAFRNALNRLVVNNYAAVLVCHLEFVQSAYTLRHACDEVGNFLGRVNLRRAQYFGDFGAKQPRNMLVNSTLEALITLSKGYLRKAKKKAEELDASDPYGGHKETAESVLRHLSRKNEDIAALQAECAALETKYALMQNPDSLIVSDYVALDFETTGFSPKHDRIIELGAVRVRDGKLCEPYYSQLVNPQMKLSDDVSKLTGITDQMLAEASTIDKVLPDFIDFIAGDVLVGHNIVAFDMEFLRNEAIRLGLVVPSNKMMDTLALSRVLLPHEEKHRLLDLIRRFGIDDVEKHRACSDAVQTAKCYEYMKLTLLES